MHLIHQSPSKAGDKVFSYFQLQLRRSSGTAYQKERATLPAELPARLVERVEAYNGGPLLDDVAILVLEGP